MAGKFTKAKAEQARLKVGLYGGQGSGKTLTALMLAEGLAQIDGKRVAYVDTERGTDFYTKSIPERICHPEGFDFDALYTRSIMEALDAVRSLDTSVYGVVVIDSITHLWEAAREAYTGKKGPGGQIPIQAWAQIKRPYRLLMTAFLECNAHAILCGREGVVLGKDEDGEMVVEGTRMKAEGETPYEPHVLGRMRNVRQKDGAFHVELFVEKDRSGTLTGKTFPNPTYQTFAPIVRYLSGDTQAQIGSLDDAAEKDAAAIEAAEEAARKERETLASQIKAAILGAQTIDALKAAWSLTTGKKTKLGDDAFGSLEALKDARKVELLKAA